MIRLINEVDPKRTTGKHMAGKSILVRDKEDVFLAKVVLIVDVPYVYRWGVGYKLDTFDGWCPLPTYEVDNDLKRRQLAAYFSED
jgi:hypothetical protein